MKKERVHKIPVRGLRHRRPTVCTEEEFASRITKTPGLIRLLLEKRWRTFFLMAGTIFFALGKNLNPRDWL